MARFDAEWWQREFNTEHDEHDKTRAEYALLLEKAVSLEAELTAARTALSNADQALDTLFGRVEMLTTALTGLISEVARRGWANDHEVLDPARAALAAGVTEREAPINLTVTDTGTAPNPWAMRRMMDEAMPEESNE